MLVTAARRARVRELFDRARELAEEERRAFLRRECGSDVALLGEIGELLEGAEASTGQLGMPSGAAPGGSDPPLPERIGPYDIVAVLGRGGMGIVYRARHLVSGREVALKTVLDPDGSMLASIRREIQALARIRHPGIVRIVDDGLEVGVPWCAMELVEGTTLRALMREPRAEPSIPSARLLGIVRRLCGTLAHLHGEGIVHRDVKPENVIVTADDRPVLVDLGLTARLFEGGSRETLRAEDGVMGTVAYVAPEQLGGGPVDARADLYAIGVLLYEMTTGRAPFEGGSVTASLRERLLADPPPVASLVPALPAYLGDLIGRLLARDPNRRLGHADDVAAALATASDPVDVDAGLPRPRAYLYRPSLRGRDDVLDRLESHVASLRAGAGGIVLLGGASGVGKTAVVAALARRCVDAGLAVHTGECLPGVDPSDREGRVALQGLKSLLTAVGDRCRERGRATTERLLGARGPLLARYEPSLAALPGQGSHPRPPELPPDADRRRLFEALVDLLRALSERVPQVLILDDLQWADELTSGFLGFLSRRLDVHGEVGRGLLVVGTYRSDESTAALDALRGKRAVTDLALGRVSDAAVGEIVADMLALPQPPPRFVALLAAQSEGNPFFVAEYLRAAVTERLLERDPEGRWRLASGAALESLSMPGTILDLVSSRIDALPPGVRAVAEVAALLGREPDPALLAEVAGVREHELDSPLRELVTRHVMDDPVVTRNGRLRFHHDRLREVIVARLTEERRMEIHRGAARALEAAIASESDPRMAELAIHLDRSGQPERARGAFAAAATAAEARSSFEEAVASYRGYLGTSPPGGAERAATRRRLGRLLLRAYARASDAEELLRASLEDARDAGDRVEEASCLQVLGELMHQTARKEAAGAAFREALELARSAGLRPLQGRLLSNLAHLSRELGQRTEARSLYLEARSVGLELHDQWLLGAVELGLANLCMDEEAWDEARALYEQCSERHRAAGDVRGTISALANLALIDREQGRWPEARERYERALRHVDLAGDRRQEAMLLANLGVLEQTMGRHEEGAGLLERALAIGTDVGDELFRAAALSNLAHTRYHQGCVEEARALYLQSLDASRRHGWLPPQRFALASLANVELELGHDEEAAGNHRDAVGLLPTSGDRNDPSVSLLLARYARLVGQGAAAREHARSAVEVLRRGRRLGDLANAFVELARVGLATGEDPSAAAREARAIAAELQMTPGSPLRVALDRLEQAMALHAAGGALWRGEVPEQLPATMHRGDASSRE